MKTERDRLDMMVKRQTWEGTEMKMYRSKGRESEIRLIHILTETQYVCTQNDKKEIWKYSDKVYK